MIEIIETFPKNVVAAVASGRVTGQDYETSLVPRVTAAMNEYRKVRCYYELGADYVSMELGALWQDFKLGIEYLTRWERVAAVTDVPWTAHAVHAFRFLLPGDVRVFATSEKEAARAWVVAP